MQTRISEAQIRALVSAFYTRVRSDALLGPIFEARLAGRWEAHQEKMCDFWSSVLLASGRYRGNPIQVHAQIEEMTPSALDRWMALFRDTSEEVLPDDLARDVVGRSARMRVVLERNREGPVTLERRR